MEATISVICNKFKILKNGESPIMVRVAKDGKRSMKSLGVSVNPIYWDFSKNTPKKNCPNRAMLMQLISQTLIEHRSNVFQLFFWMPSSAVWQLRLGLNPCEVCSKFPSCPALSIIHTTSCTSLSSKQGISRGLLRPLGQGHLIPVALQYELQRGPDVFYRHQLQVSSCSF